MAKRKRTSHRASRLAGAHGLGSIRSVQSFRQTINDAPPLSTANRKRLVQQARILVEQLYAHLPLKRAMHAIDPVQSLRLLEQRVSTLNIVDFNTQLLEIFKSLKDLHTNYSLPSPFGSQIAFVGILIEQFTDGDQQRWLVSKVADHLVSDSNLQAGVEITHWNGMPIALAVRRNAQKEAGSNTSAQLARGLETLTLRFMRASAAPDEDWATITYESNSNVHETRLDWLIFDSIADLTGGSGNPSGLLTDLTVPLRYLVGVDETRERLRMARKQLFNPSAVREEKRTRRYKGKVPRATASLNEANILPTSRPDEITARLVDTPSGTFGYIRLWTFHMRDNDIGAFVQEFIRLVDTQMPVDGMIIDVRGNGGGFVIAAEFLLQLLTPNHIQPEPAQFIATDGTLDIVNKVDSMAPWRASLKQAIRTGAIFSSGIPLSPESVVNSIGQLYFGPIVLITDAYCYSACDMFAAGFQDNDIGLILGVDDATGAGGANVLTHDALRSDWTDGPLQTLPNGAGMRVSLRRTLRVGERAGEPVEDLGVTPDELHHMTRNDVLNGNEDLLARAGEILATSTPREFSAELSSSAGNLVIELTTLNIKSVDVYINERPLLTQLIIVDGVNTLQLPMPAGGSLIQIDGYTNDDLVASRKHILN